MQEPRGKRFEALPEVGQARGARRGVGEAVVVANPGDDVHPFGFAAQLPVEPGDLVGGVVRLAAARREISHIEVAWRQLGQLGGELDRRRRSKAAIGRAEGESPHLLGGHGGKDVPAVAHIHVPERGHAVDVLASVDVGQRRTVSADQDQLRDRSLWCAKVALRMQPVRLVELGKPARFLG